MEFTSLWEEAGHDAEGEVRDRALAKASAAAAGIWPFLSLASTESEFDHRLALAEDRLSTIAANNGVSLEDLTRQYRTAFQALAEQRHEAYSDEFDSRHSDERGPKNHDFEPGGGTFGDGSPRCKHCDWHPDEHRGKQSSRKEAEAAPACRNCGHANPPHRKGGQCSACGCDSYQPGTRGSSPRRASWEQHYASIRQALMEGQDPLAWVEETAPQGQGQPEKPGGHTTQSEPYTYAEVPPGQGDVVQRAGGLSDMPARHAYHPPLGEGEAFGSEDPDRNSTQLVHNCGECGAKMTSPYGSGPNAHENAQQGLQRVVDDHMKRKHSARGDRPF